MAIDGNILALLIRTKMHDKFKLVMPYNGPMAQPNPSYFIAMCDAIGKGLVQSTPSISFVTADTGFSSAPPIPGVGLGQGIIVDTAWFTRKLYIELRQKFIGQFGVTNHPIWCDEWNVFGTVEAPLPPLHCSLSQNQYNPYNFLTAMCEAISEGVTEHYAEYRILNSTHPTVYSGAGLIEEGGFHSIVASTVGTAIQGLGTALQGAAWPNMCQAIGTAYAEAIMGHSTGEVVITGVCVPSPSQVCGTPLVGVGTGTAT